ncbi:MAG: peptidyl-prolyl cis-trans isomerase [Gemmatimonadota bacterium]|nr:peptidyl-prolyl cis-trans isomerase [Gemmatimonadota bacterium]
MMRKLRESTKIIMVVVAVAFVGLMVFEWGMDLSGRTGQGQPATTELGMVNGVEITIEEYQRQYQNLLQRAQEQNPGGLSSQQLSSIEQQAWDQLVNRKLLLQAARERGIEVSDSEIVEFIKANPPPELRNMPAFQTEGRFDLQKYREALADPALSETWRQYELQLRSQLPIQKLQEQIVAGVTVTDAELTEAYRVRNERARIEFLYLDPDVLVPEETIEVTDSDIREHYEENKEEYRQDPSARIRYAAFEPEITPEDSASARALADSLAELARQPEADFSELAEEHSDDRTTAENEGSLGWIVPDAMDAAIADALQRMEPGETAGPVQTGFGWHVIRLDDRRTVEGETRVNARHILIEVSPSEDARDEARASAREFAAAASESGFATASAGMDVEVHEPPVFEEGVVVPRLGPVPPVTEFVFENPAGSISGPISHQGSFYVVEIVDRYPAGYVALERVAPAIREELVDEKQRRRISGMTPEITEAVRQHGLEGAAERYGLEVVSSGWFNRTNNIAGVGSGTPVAGAAFGLAEGQVAGPIETDRGLFFVRLLEKQPISAEEFQQRAPQLRQELVRARMSEVFDAWFEAARERADIVDNRARILGT